MSERDNLQELVAKKLQEFLIVHNHRHTRERYAILRACYDIEGTFTIEDLKTVMDAQRFNVSTATLYSTTQLLVQANLLIRHPFSFSSVVFERIVDSRPRSYQVCNVCHRITQIKSKELAMAISSYRPRRFSISHRVSYVYGTCPKCAKRMKSRL